MTKVSEIIDEVIREMPYMESFIKEDIVNFSALAKKISAYVSKRHKLTVSESSILMALKRYHSPVDHREKKLSFYIKDLDNLKIWSNLSLLRINKKSLFDKNKLRGIIQLLQGNHTLFYRIFDCDDYISIVFNEKMIDLFEGLNFEEKMDKLSVISFKFSNADIQVPGLYYVVFKQLSWNNINIIETISSGKELMVVVSNQDVVKISTLIQNVSVDLFSL